jgi:hypothetical protein
LIVRFPLGTGESVELEVAAAELDIILAHVLDEPVAVAVPDLKAVVPYTVPLATE